MFLLGGVQDYHRSCVEVLYHESCVCVFCCKILVTFLYNQSM